MEDDLNGRQTQGKMTSMEDNFNEGGQPCPHLFHQIKRA